ncbi:hypothetical protein ACFXPY_35225 [Streptomyces sp. NPDC059153]|uniref:hypothetical protein n=1 Tax=Streptomyces sp. NPDC059153 TaxID=3346743 RepID=UPI0036ABB23B
MSFRSPAGRSGVGDGERAQVFGGVGDLVAGEAGGEDFGVACGEDCAQEAACGGFAVQGAAVAVGEQWSGVFGGAGGGAVGTVE